MIELHLKEQNITDLVQRQRAVARAHAERHAQQREGQLAPQKEQQRGRVPPAPQQHGRRAQHGLRVRGAE